MAVSQEYLDYLRDQLDAFGPFEVRRMFGGMGLFRDGLMFAIVASDALYLKVDDRNRGDFEAVGMAPFGYERRGKRAALKSYYEAPPDVLEDPNDFADWARRAFDAAVASAKAKS